jgi:hypothetical protein
MPPGVVVAGGAFSAIQVRVKSGVTVGNGVNVCDGGCVAVGITSWAIASVGVWVGASVELAV